MPRTWSIQSNLKTEGLPYLSPRLALRYSRPGCPGPQDLLKYKQQEAIWCHKDTKAIEYPHWGAGHGSTTDKHSRWIRNLNIKAKMMKFLEE